MIERITTNEKRIILTTTINHIVTITMVIILTVILLLQVIMDMGIKAITMGIIIEEVEGITQEIEEDIEIIIIVGIIITIIGITIVDRIAQEEMSFGEDNTNKCIKVINM